MNIFTWKQQWQRPIQSFLREHQQFDAGHDWTHLQRVVTNAITLAERESAEIGIVLPSAWMHDCVTVPKNNPNRKKASRFSAEKATEQLRQLGYPTQYLDGIYHAIHAHSFSAKIDPTTIEAKVVQDADRLDGLGAIGLLRCVATGVEMGATFYHPDDPFGEDRELDDKAYSVDHFYKKLLTLADTMQTAYGREMAQQRTLFLHQFLDQLRSELTEIE